MRHFKTDKPSAAVNNAIGRPFVHESAIKQVIGKAAYIDDRAEEVNSLHAYPVLSTISCGKIISIDSSEALKIEGVVAIYGAQDIPGENDVSPIFTGDILLTDDVIEYHSQPILLVVATSYQTARIAAKKVVIEYQATPAAMDIKQAIANKSWVRPPHALHRGDAQQAIKEQSIKLVESYILLAKNIFI